MTDSATGRPKILVVDDIEINRIILDEILSDAYVIEQASDGLEAISILLNTTVKPNLILLDIMMPGMDGFEVLQFIKANDLLKKIPVIFITAANEEKKGLRAGAVDYISKPFEPEIVKLRVATQIELDLYRENLEGLVEQKAQELLTTKENFLETVANLIEYRSLESSYHVKRTRELARILATQLLKGSEYAQELIDCNYNMLIKAVPLHDIGKIGIPDNILLKPGKLTPEEFKIIESHTLIGGDVVASLMANSVEEDDYLLHCLDICKHHHERWDGTGYPDKLANLQIPLSARIVSVVDVYDALANERCYKSALSHEDSVGIIVDASGSHHDPVIVNAMLEVQEEFRDLKNKIHEL